MPPAGLAEIAHRVVDIERRLREAHSEIARLRARLARAELRANTDSLTGIANRRGFLDCLEVAVTEANRRGRSLSLLMIDVDHFKTFNDRFGHHVGDDVLRLVANSLRELEGNARFAGRYGGEEFAIVLPDREPRDAAVIAERLRRAIALRHFFMRGTGEEVARITVSIGIAGLYPGEKAKELIRRADAALYRAKRTGRNRVVCDEADLHRAASL